MPRSIDVVIDRILKRFENPNYQSPALGPLVPITDDSYYGTSKPEPVHYYGCYSDDITAPIPTAASTPGRQNEQVIGEPNNEIEDFEEIFPSALPRPNDSIASSMSGNADNVMVYQPPLTTPKPKSGRLNRQQSLQPFARMAALDSDDEDENETAGNQTAPPTVELNQLMEYIDKKFEKLEASFGKK